MYIHKLKEKLKLRLNKRFVHGKTNILGFPIEYVDKSSFLSMFNEIFERKIYQFQSIKKDVTPFIIDCGANIGLSLIYFKQNYPNCNIVAFEPDPFIFNVLKRNIDKINNSGIELINACLDEKDGVISFFSEGSDGGRIAESNDNRNLIDVRAVTLYNYINKIVDFLKIDIEGAEYLVLKNIEDKLHLVKNIFVEYHSFTNSPQQLGEILLILKNAGFRYYIETTGVKSRDPYLKIETYLNFDSQVNIFGYRI